MKTLELLEQSKKNFEALDTAMRTEGVPVHVAQEAFESGMRDLSTAIQILKLKGKT
jgi:hypothetical protein